MLNRTFTIVLALSLPLISSAFLKSEVLDVTITWNAAQCQARCNQLLQAQFGKIYGVSSVEVNQAAGQANLKWKPKARFSFQPIDTALRMVGPSPNNIRVKVKGQIRHDSRSVQLISDGDGTIFFLVNPLVVVPNQYNVTSSQFNRQLTPDLQEKLISTQNNKQNVTITGSLFLPYRSPPLQLIVENLSIEDSK